jgi:glycosyltransferase involved in cell wall biosynthesis
MTELINQSNPHKVITPSYWMQRQFQLAYPETRSSVLQVIPNMPNQNGVDLDARIRKIPGSRKNLLFVASDITQPLKGLTLLLEAMGNFRDSVNLSIVGFGEIDLSFEAQANIHILGSLTREKLQEQFEICDALIVPSFSENRPNVIIEAQLSGLFVLASDVGGIPEMIQEGQTGILFRPTVEELIRALERYLEMPEETKFGIEERALVRARAENNPIKIIELHTKVYTELIDEYRQGNPGGRAK